MAAHTNVTDQYNGQSIDQYTDQLKDQDTDPGITKLLIELKFGTLYKHWYLSGHGPPNGQWTEERIDQPTDHPTDQPTPILTY